MPDSISDPFEQLARQSLLEITTADTVGALVSRTDEGDGAVSLAFEATQPGYPGWRWTVSIAQLDGAEPSVLEAELMPGEGALLAPDWVPWSDRLAEYEAAQALLVSEGAADDSSDDDASDDDDDDDDDEEDDDDDEDGDDEDDDIDEDDITGSDVLHGGDLDGVDIDDPDDDDSDEDDLDIDDPDEDSEDDGYEGPDLD
jgi:hypothetical protein